MCLKGQKKVGQQMAESKSSTPTDFVRSALAKYLTQSVFGTAAHRSVVRPSLLLFLLPYRVCVGGVSIAFAALAAQALKQYRSCRTRTNNIAGPFYVLVDATIWAAPHVPRSFNPIKQMPKQSLISLKKRCSKGVKKVQQRSKKGPRKVKQRSPKRPTHQTTSGECRILARHSFQDLSKYPIPGSFFSKYPSPGLYFSRSPGRSGT